jgi:hypothetical protein
MRPRKLFGLFLNAFGLVLVAVSLGAYAFHARLPVSNVLLTTVAVLSLVVGLVVLVLESIEGWLDRTQTALVDGLQAG